MPQLGWDVASPHQNGGFSDGTGVLVYAEKDGPLYVLLARRADWLLNGKGTWGAFGGTVAPSDLDDAGNRSFSRAAEPELYEESVTVYHQTDAKDLRNGATRLHLPAPAGQPALIPAAERGGDDEERCRVPAQAGTRQRTTGAGPEPG